MTTSLKGRGLAAKVRLLRAERDEWLSNRCGPFAHWGVPFCTGTNCEGVLCLGCRVSAYCKDMASAVERRIADLTKPAAEPLEGELFSLIGGRWVTR